MQPTPTHITGPLSERPFQAEASRARCRKFRLRILDMSQKVPALHMGAAFSCMELVEAAYFCLMRRDLEGRSPDTFVMSKGHGCLAQYVALEELGVMPAQEIEKYCKPGGLLGSHPDLGNPGIEASTGSLGHGLLLAVGMSYADRTMGHDRDMYVVLSDGELQEGSAWEAVLLAPDLKVNRLVAFLDLNDFQSSGQTSKIHPNFYPVDEKLRAFGWEARLVDGHDSAAIVEAVRTRQGDRPLMVIARTTKGKGVSFMENVPIWHYRSPNPQEYQQALSELSASG